MWEAIGALSFATAMMAGVRRANAEHAEAQRQYEAQKRIADELGAYRAFASPPSRLGTTTLYGGAIGARSAPAKCHGCGSHEWRQHNNVRICAYCRSGQ